VAVSRFVEKLFCKLSHFGEIGLEGFNALMKEALAFFTGRRKTTVVEILQLVQVERLERL